VVFTDAVSTGPTKRFHRSSTLMSICVAVAVEDAVDEPFVNVGVPVVAF
jgi:hypothetical protein